MLKPDELETEEGQDIWETFLAASQGDVVSLRRLIEKNPAFSRAEFWYTPAVHQVLNTQSAIANRRFADILLQHPYEFAASGQEI